ncbi:MULTISPECIES: ABC transporter ATP-binding protein [Spirulina sp. CCY15215]|uniref:ABC transporter ATP-binding protein n=1 Tax=Spirulina sp. CCY15215 TaxID=2767591 RepID=UPI001950CAB3|nr:ABC transporter ATP-binding protein [Spirulina major]
MATKLDTQLPDIELRHFSQIFDSETVVKEINLRICKGEFFCLLGPSGCGKTTILRAIAGFESPSSGEVWIQGQLMNKIPPYRRPVNTVFQSYALFNHLTVRENIAFSLKLKKCPKNEREARIQQALKQVKLEEFAQRYPDRLSGGQKQRVALARALINQPAVLLLDEPLGALDLKLRKEMQLELARLHREMGLTFLMVTHDREEALSLADRIAVIQQGNLEQIGSPRDIYERPQTAFVADFIGETNLLYGYLDEEGNIVTESGLVLKTQGSKLSLGNREMQTKDEIVLSIRPEKIKIRGEPIADCENCYPGQIQQITYLGTHLQIVVSAIATGEILRIRQTDLDSNSELSQFSTGALVYIGWHNSDSLIFSPNT